MTNFYFAYVPDVNNPNRTMTIAYTISGNRVRFGFSINAPTEWVCAYSSQERITFVKKPGDQFNKRKGKEIAIGRYESKKSTTLVTSGTLNKRDALIEILNFLAITQGNRHVSRMAKQEAEYLLWCCKMDEGKAR